MTPDATTATARAGSSPGVDLLLSIGTAEPHLMLPGAVLEEQGRLVTGLLEEGHHRATLRAVLTAPLPTPLKTSVAAVLAGRLRKLPPPSSAPLPPSVPTVPNQVSAASHQEQSAFQPPRCTGADCGRMAEVTDPTPLCGACAGWPACGGGCGRHLPEGGVCSACEYAATIQAEPAPDGTCQGWDQKGCGRPVRGHGLCGRCEVKANQHRVAERRVRDAVVHESLREHDPDWAREIDDLVSAVTAQEGQQGA
ncbi:hypothetical protein ABZ820_33740 [Streptomyces diacarni]|uniref:hypothetical protein n=1 Tax=Streptomyces diacarni TaxID=2800381 RepID=UPI003405A356